MQLLFEEFLRKVYGLSEGKTSLLLKVWIRFMFYLLLSVFLGVIVYSIITKRYIIILIILGLVIVGECAHFIRKSREKGNQKVVPKDSSKEHTKEILKLDRIKNKSLLKTNKSKNKNLLNKSKNKKLLK